MDTIFNLKNIKLLVGLGNVGDEYENTRHNIGFKFLDKISDNSKFLFENKFNSHVRMDIIFGNKLILIKPSTFMNESGRAVASIIKFYRLKTEEILIIYDDLDIRLGEYKIQFSKNPRIHNGVNSIIQHLGSSNFWNIRIGIDNRNDVEKSKIAGSDYVLGRFKKEELKIVDEVFHSIISEI